MNRYYKDILAIANPHNVLREPIWFDENAVPRFCQFSPAECDIYAEEVVLLLIECQNCAHEFQVAMSWNTLDAARYIHETKVAHPNLPDWKPFSEQIQQLHYGDPPNIECCESGLSMNSIPKRVIEFWQKQCDEHNRSKMVRRADLELAINCDWAND